MNDFYKPLTTDARCRERVTGYRLKFTVYSLKFKVYRLEFRG